MLYITVAVILILAIALLLCVEKYVFLLEESKLRHARCVIADETINNALQHARIALECGEVEGWPAWRWKDQINILEENR